jgi:hypothetical protein
MKIKDLKIFVKFNSFNLTSTEFNYPTEQQGVSLHFTYYAAPLVLKQIIFDENSVNSIYFIFLNGL